MTSAVYCEQLPIETIRHNALDLSRLSPLVVSVCIGLIPTTMEIGGELGRRRTVSGYTDKVTVIISNIKCIDLVSTTLKNTNRWKCSQAFDKAGSNNVVGCLTEGATKLFVVWSDLDHQVNENWDKVTGKDVSFPRNGPKESYT